MLYRFHVVDEIYFENGFRMTMDNLAWTGSKYGSRYDDYTTVAYYLLEEPQKLPFPLPDDNDLFMK